MTHRVLSIDPSSFVGWAFGTPGATPVWGSRKFDGKSTGAVCGLFRHWINQRCYELRPTVICLEAPYVPHARSKIPMNPMTLRRLLGMVATIEAVAWELRIPCREATTLEIARFFIGTQRLKRDEKKLRTIEMCQRYGWDVSNDNEADALALWHLAEFTYSPEIAARRGSGPLFIPPKQANAPPIVTDRGALLFPTPEGSSSNARLAR